MQKDLTHPRNIENKALRKHSASFTMGSAQKLFKQYIQECKCHIRLWFYYDDHVSTTPQTCNIENWNLSYIFIDFWQICNTHTVFAFILSKHDYHNSSINGFPYDMKSH